jgi:hypothetical protein
MGFFQNLPVEGTVKSLDQKTESLVKPIVKNSIPL